MSVFLIHEDNGKNKLLFLLSLAQRGFFAKGFDINFLYYRVLLLKHISLNGNHPAK